MSKAFTKETDREDGEAEEPDPLPAQAKNYVTPEGMAALQEEFRKLLYEERPKVVETVSWAAGNGDRSENGDYIYGKKRLREIDGRVRYLSKRIESAEVVDPARQKNRDQVFFGATVEYVRKDNTRAQDNHRRHRRGRPRERQDQLAVARRARADESTCR